MAACSSTGVKSSTGAENDSESYSENDSENYADQVKKDSQQQALTLAQKAERSGFIQLAIDMYKSQLQQNPQGEVAAISRSALFWLYRQNKQHTFAEAVLTEQERQLTLAEVLADQSLKQQISQRFNGLMNWRCIRAVRVLDADQGVGRITDTGVNSAWLWLNQQPALNSNKLQASLRHCYPLKARLLTQQGEQQQAQALYQRLLLNDPENWQHRYNLALNYLLAKQYNKAQALLLPGCQSQSCALPLRQLLALSFGLQNDEQQALKWLAPLAPNEQQQQLEIYRQWRQRLNAESSGENN